MINITQSKLFVTLTSFILFISTSSLYAMDVKKVFEDTRPSVVLIMAFDNQDEWIGQGSGFFFGDSRTIATNLHVVRNASRLVIKLSNGDLGELTTVLGTDLLNDLALLKSTVTGKVLVGADRLPDIGEDIIAIGNPKGLEGTVSSGIVSGIRAEKISSVDSNNSSNISGKQRWTCRRCRWLCSRGNNVFFR